MKGLQPDVQTVCGQCRSDPTCCQLTVEVTARQSEGTGPSGLQEVRSVRQAPGSGVLAAFSTRFLWHLSLQYFTSHQTFSHFFRHLKDRPQTTQVFSGSMVFL